MNPWLLFLALLLVALPASAEEEEELPLVAFPEVVEFIEADYPPEALEEGLEATVVLLVELDEEGRVLAAEVVEPAGHGFDEAAVEAVLQMQFTPARTEEGPVPVLFEMPYHFTFVDDEEEDPAEETDAPPPPVNLEGEVIEMGTRRPIAGARVVVEGTDLVGQTDDEGRFTLRGVPLGDQTLRVHSPAHISHTSTIEIPEGEVVTWRFWLRAETYREHEAVGFYRREREEVTRRTLSIEEVRRVPGTFGDPINVVQTLPGAARSPFGTGFLIIRGANPEDTGVYVDGVRIPIIYHLTGTTSVLSPELIEAVDYLPGGYGAQYGRTMGGVVDVRTRSDFEDHKLVWGTDILDSNVYYEGRLGRDQRHGVAVAARRSYIDAFIPLFTGGTDFTLRPRYWDYQAKWVPRLEGEQEFSVFVYGSDDLLEVATPADVAQGTDADTQGDLRTQYASQRLIVRYQRKLAEGLSLDVTPSIGIDYADFGLGDAFRLATFNTLFELRAEMPWELGPALTLAPGLDLIGGFWSFDFAAPFTFEQAGDPLAERESIAFDGRGSGWGPDLYFRALLRPLPDRERLLIVPGVRANLMHVTYQGSILGDAAPSWSRASVDPRLATRFSLVEGLTLKASTGLYHQPPQPHQLIGLGADVTLGFERAWNSSFGVEHQISPAVAWDIDLFYRDLDRLIDFRSDWEGFGDQHFDNVGIGRAYGVELILRHAPVNRFFGWISYTLSRSERKAHPDRDWIPFDFDQTHILSAQAGYDLPLDFGISAQVQYVTGNPTSLYDTGIYDADWDSYNPFRIGPANADRLPPFVQTSLRFDRLWTFRGWQLETYVDLMNVVRGVNPEFTLYNYDYTDAAYVRGLPFIPNIGIEARFWP